MKKINFEKIFKKSAIYLIYTGVVLSSFFLGTIYKDLTADEPQEIERFLTIYREDVSIALDEGDNLIIIDKESGNYTIYQDSIGNSIFKLYAKNIWRKD